MQFIFIYVLLVIDVTKSYNFHQGEFILIPLRAVIEEINPDRVKMNIRNDMYNRTTRAYSSNITVFKDIVKSEATIQVYKWLNNRYQKYAPIQFKASFCVAIAANSFGIKEVLKSGNLTECPIRKGSYYISNYVADVTKYPPHIPEGTYRLQTTLHSENELLVSISWYGRIYRPITYKKSPT